MLAEQRHRLILELLNEKQLVTIAQLGDALDASDATIRRDLGKLESDGKLVRVHGGAQLAEQTSARRRQLEGTAFLANREVHAREKRLIAERAVALCEDGESIIINGGSSTFMMAEFLATRHLNILTNSFPLALELAESSDNTVTLPGGELYRKQNIILSAFDSDTIQHYHAKRMFMGTPGIGEFGVMESDPLLVRAELKLLRRADELVVLADSSKLGRRSSLILCGLDAVSILITDDKADASQLALFESQGVETIVVEVPPGDSP